MSAGAVHRPAVGRCCHDTRRRQGIDGAVYKQARHAARLHCFYPAKLGDADKVFQDTSLILWEKRASYDPERSFIAWRMAFHAMWPSASSARTMQLCARLNPELFAKVEELRLRLSNSCRPVQDRSLLVRLLINSATIGRAREGRCKFPAIASARKRLRIQSIMQLLAGLSSSSIKFLSIRLLGCRQRKS